MKIKISILLIFNFYFIFAQDRYSEIKYSFIINSGGTNQIILDCALLHNSSKNESTFINFGFNSIPEKLKTETTNIHGEKLVNIEKYDNNYGQKPEYQKYFQSDSLISHESVFGEKKYYLIKEKLPSFEWVILNDTLTILNQKTQKAKVKFRGREYYAWFTTKIKISDGPYKFYGLPGLILKIESIDEKYKFEAYSIKLNIIKDNFSILKLTHKYSDKKLISIKDKIKLITKNTEKERKYRLSKNSNITEVKIEHSGLELNFNDIINER
jgi:GLPGLI family protein